MNIFILSEDPVIAAQMHFDKHINKMYIELAQMLSTAHRICDGTETIVPANGKSRKKKVFVHPTLDDVLYSATHYNHPSSVWIRTSIENYNWAYQHFVALCKEFTHRSPVNKVTLTETKLLDILKTPPKNLKKVERTPFALAFKNNPKAIVFNDKVQSYRNFYLTKQIRMETKWTNREVPEWWSDNFVQFLNEEELKQWRNK